MSNLCKTFKTTSCIAAQSKPTSIGTTKCVLFQNWKQQEFWDKVVNHGIIINYSPNTEATRSGNPGNLDYPADHSCQEAFSNNFHKI